MKSPLENITPTATTIDMPLLKIEVRGEAVRFLQELLKLRYGYNISVDSIFGSKTAAAVKDFQINHPPLAVDGIVGKKTWRELSANLACC